MASSQQDDVTTNTEIDLQALFDSVLTPGGHHPQQVPWSMRNLPDSFFNPPTTGSKTHSRENSSDSGALTSSGIFTTSTLNSVPLQSVHLRTHSSPASLQHTLGEVSQSHQHVKQHSYNVVKSEYETPLPYGWEEAKTPSGQSYYLNHFTKTTTWDDPRKFQSPQTVPVANQNIVSSPTSSKISSDPLGELPEGWEQSVTPEGEIYFINHLTQSTSWFDPRIPTHLQQSSSDIASPWYNNLATNSINIKQQDLRLQLLHLEREKLKERREELRKQQLLGRGAKKLLPNQYSMGLNDHSRQESSDSAIGESLKDWISTDSSAGSSMLLASDIFDQSEPDCMDMSDIGFTIESTDDLVPSLQMEKDFSI